MPQLGQAQQGALKSTPKLTKINGDDHDKVIFRNMGNNHAYPFIWATTATVVSGTSSVVVASGIKWHGYDLATHASVAATPKGNVGYCYTTADTVANTITLNCSSSASAGDVDVALIFMLGGDLDATGLACRGNTGAAQSLP
jgi:hypothetical protein